MCFFLGARVPSARTLNDYPAQSRMNRTSRLRLSKASLAMRCAQVRDRRLGLGEGFSSSPARVRARFSSLRRRRDSLSAGPLLPPPAWSLWRRRHRPAPGRSAPPPRPRCWPGGAPEPPRATVCSGPKLCNSLESDSCNGPSLHLPPRPFGSWLIPELSESPS